MTGSDVGVGDQQLSLGAAAPAVERRLASWVDERFSRRLWAKDHTLFAAALEPELIDRLGWLDLPRTMQAEVQDLDDFAAEVARDGIRQAVLLGMGGSSLAPDVFQHTFGAAAGRPQLLVLDSTHPDAVRAVHARIDPAATLFIVSSKSGTTLETLSFFRYFWGVVAESTDSPGAHFAAVSDPGTPLIELAHERGFRRVFEARPDIGGRYSALTHFGMVPAAVIGVDLHALLDRAETVATQARKGLESESEALALGAALGELALAGRDKATFLVSSTLAAFPGWAEQLIAESTGKSDRGIVPIADEPAGTPADYADDRVFVHLRLDADDEADRDQSARVDALEAAGHPIIRIRLPSVNDLGREMYRAELAVAAAGVVLGIHPFNQPDVELAKDLARQAMAGELRSDAAVDPPVPTDGALELQRRIEAWVGQAGAGDYLAIHAYLPPTATTTCALQAIRLTLRARTRRATTVGYGPRFLHSTGQLHKGGPNTGLYLQILSQPADDLAVPESDFAFGELMAAQAEGDFQALLQRGRRVLRVQTGADVSQGLAAIHEALHG